MRDEQRLTALIWLAAVAACGEGPPPVAPHAIPLGALADVSGGTGSTTQYKAAAELAARQMNQGLQLAGSDIRFALKVLDSRGDPVTSQAAAIDLINNHDAVGLVTDFSAVTAAVNQLNYDPSRGARRKVPVGCYGCSSSFLNDSSYVDADPMIQAAHRDADNWLFRVFYNGKYESLLQARVALGQGPAANGDVNGDGRFKLGIYAQNDSYGRSTVAETTEAIQALAPGRALSIEVIEVDHRVDINSYDWGRDLGRFFDDKAADGAPDVPADALFVALLPNPAMAAVKTYREAAFTAPLLTTSAFRRNYILRNLGPVANGVEGNSPFLYANDESGLLFHDALVSAIGEPPEQLCANTYDGVVALMLSSLMAAVHLDRPDEVEPEAVRAAMTRLFDPAGEVVRPTPADFARAFSAIQAGRSINYRGASGVKFDARGENFPRLVHWRVEGGRFRDLEAYDCSPQAPACLRLE
jgi:ABC-type branched-subunit amino acid transport system substrate-binding protein